MRLIARLPRNPERAAALAGVLAFVRHTDERRVARAVGRVLPSSSVGEESLSPNHPETSSRF